VIEVLDQRGVDLPIRKSMEAVIGMNAEIGRRFSS
jgi:hypothetical protein